MRHLLNKKFLIKFYILLSWSILLLSINSMPGEIVYMKHNFITFINGLRTILAILVSFLSIILLFVSLKNRKIKRLSIILILFFLYFFLQIIGLITTEGRPFDIHRTYLIIYSFGTIALFFLVYFNNLNKILPYMWIIALFIVFMGYTITTINSPQTFLDVITRGSLYWFFHPDGFIFYQAPPRITGLTRTAGLISIFLIILLFYINRINFASVMLTLFLLLLSTIIWMGQSRGSILCFYVTSSMMILLIKNFNLFKKFILLLIVYLLPILVSVFIVNFASKINITNSEIVSVDNSENNYNSEKNDFDVGEVDKVMSELLKLKETSRVISGEAGTSGRTTLWKNAFEKFEKNKIFGYGPQADRYLLYDIKNKYGNNVSNTLIYAFLSGGYFSLIIMITIFIYTLFLIYKFIVNNKILNKKTTINENNIFVFLAIFYIIFFGVRSIFENSFGLFSIDYLFVILSLFVLENKISNQA